MSIFFYVFFFRSRYLQDRRVWIQLYDEIKHSGKMDMILIEKGKLSDFSRIISLPNAEPSENLSTDGRDPFVHSFHFPTPRHC